MKDVSSHEEIEEEKKSGGCILLETLAFYRSEIQPQSSQISILFNIFSNTLF